MKTSIIKSSLIVFWVLSPYTIAIASNSKMIEHHDSYQKNEKIKIHTIRIKNSSILTEDQKQNITQEWQGEYFLTDILSRGFQIAETITKLYHKQGYVTSRTIVPTQDQFAEGILILEVIEGSVEGIKLGGVKTLSKDYILSRIPAIYAKPFNVIDLNNDLQNLQRDPLIKSLNSSVEKGSEEHYAVLIFNIEENPTQTLSLQGSNNAPTNTGSEEGFFTYEHRNLFGGGQKLFFQYSGAEGKDTGFASFSFPLTSDNTRLQFRGQIESNDIITEPLSQFEFENDVFTYGIDLIHPVFENSRNNIISTITYDNHRSQNYIFGERFEIDERFPNGIAQYDVLRVSFQWIQQRETNVLSFTPQLNFGIDRGFFSGRFWGDFLQSISDNLTLSFHISAQVADDILFPQEQCKIGGSGYRFGAIRGYTRQAFRNDNCVAATLQSSWVFFKNEQVGLELTPFLQAGAVWKAQESPIPEETLASTGLELGLSWGNFFVKGYSAFPLVNVADEFKDPFGVTGGVNFSF